MQKLTSKEIRFITPNYETLFMLPDGGEIKVTYLDGVEVVRTCRYIDEHHLYVGYNVYHICEFAEHMERMGARVEKMEVAV